MDLVELQCGSRKNYLRHSEFLCGGCICLLFNNATQELYVINVAAYLLCVVCEYNLYIIYSTFHESVVPHLTTTESEFWIFAL